MTFLRIVTSAIPVGAGEDAVMFGVVLLEFVVISALDTGGKIHILIITCTASQQGLNIHFTGRTKHSVVYPSDFLIQGCDVFLTEARLENVSGHAGEKVTIIVL